MQASTINRFNFSQQPSSPLLCADCFNAPSPHPSTISPSLSIFTSLFMQADIQKAIWAGTVPLVITLSSDDLTDFVVPKPLHLTVPRIILWSSVIAVVHSYFIKQTAQLESAFYPYDNKFLLTSNAVLEACTNELDLAEIKSPVWLEGPGKTVIDWKVPVGVCADLWASTAMNSNYVESPHSLPIKIIAHFTKRPDSLSDCHVVVCRGWSSAHKERSKKDEDEKKGKTEKDADLISKHAINTTKRALLEHNTRHLLPIFLQLPSSTHIHTSLSRIRMSSSSLHNSPTSVMGLPTPTQSQFVSCLYSNSVSELSTTVPMCGCHDCTTFLTTLAGYDLHHNSSSVPHKAAKAVKMGMQKVLSALKRDSDSDSDDPISPESPSSTTAPSAASTTSSTTATATTSPFSTLANSSSIPPTMVTPGNDPQTSKALVHRSEMTKEQKEQWSILTTPASMLLCQITRLIMLSRTLCGTLSSFEKAAEKLETEVKDVWRRKVGRFEVAPSQPQSPTSNPSTTASTTPSAPPATPSISSSTTIQAASTPLSTFSLSNSFQANFSVNDILNDSSVLYNTIIPKGWKPYYHYLPIKLYFTHHIGMLCNAPTTKGAGSHLEKDGNGYSIKWTRNRLVTRLDAFSQYLSQSPSQQQLPISDIDPTTISTPTSVSTARQPFRFELATLPPSIQELISTSPYCEDITVEQFINVIFPHWKYKYAKPPQHQSKSHSNDSDTDATLHNSQPQQPLDDDKGPSLVMVCHGIAIPYNTPIIWLYNHFVHPDLTLHITIALQEDIE